MATRTETKTKAPSVKYARQDLERHLMSQVKMATDVASADQWLTLYERFQRSQNGVAPSSNGTDTGAGGQQAVLPLTSE